uniref:Uncharacterized protein n=1 Tax=Chenopodium quinoa TaxID=63459 RepID=A0A803L2C5_CHEQI
MGNLLGLCAVGGSTSNQDKVLQVMNVHDRKILEFRAPIKVKDLLKNYPNFYVGLFKEATQPLPLEYKLEVGKIYYLLPCFSATILEPNNIGDVSSSSSPIPKPRNGVVRIKMVITRKQLRQLLSSQAMRVETMLLEIGKKSCYPVVMSSSHLQKLQPIGEESE